MNAPTRTVFFNKNKPNSEELSQFDSANSISTKIDDSLSNLFPISLSEFTDPKKFDEKLNSIQNELDKEIKLYGAIHKQLLKKSESVLLSVGANVVVKKTKEDAINLVEKQKKKCHPRWHMIYVTL